MVSKSKVGLNPPTEKQDYGVDDNNNKMSKNILLLFLIITSKFSFGQIIDSCFSSVTPIVSSEFTSSPVLANIFSSDVLEWDGSNWVGGYQLANLTIAPPINLSGCRAIFIGNSSTWTSGGESFGLLLNSPLVDGQNYSFNFSYVSHGLGSDGNFSPFFYTSSSPNFGSVNLVGNLPAVGYNWTTNTFSFTATAAQAGDTWIIIGTQPNGSSGIIRSFCNNCNCSTTINNNQILQNDTTLCQGETLTLNATTSNASYLWQDNSTNPSFNVTQKGTYWVEVTLNNCVTTDSILINEEDCEIILEMPNVFTPNNDGINDLFVPIISKGIVSMKTIIYNRWGKEIFESNELLIEWSGQDISDGTYFWIICYTDINGVENNLNGYVSVMND